MNNNINSSVNIIDFDSVYKTYYKEIVSYVSFKVNSSDIAEELANDSFMKLYHNIDSFNPEKSKLRTWLFTIVNNTVIDYYRSHKKDSNKTSIDSSIGSIELHNNINNGFNNLCNTDINNKVKFAINNLSNENLKHVAKLYFIDDLNYNEISEALNIPMGSVKAYINRVRIELQKSLRSKEVFI